MKNATPGPWKFFSNDVNIGVTSLVADIAHCGGMCSDRSKEETEANARLISFAPDMYNFIKLVAAGHLTQKGMSECAERMLERISE